MSHVWVLPPLPAPVPPPSRVPIFPFAGELSALNWRSSVADTTCMTAQVLSKNLLDTNELLKNHQVQVQTLGDKLKVVEDEKTLIAEKLANAQRDMLSRDTSMLQLKTEVHALQQVSTPTSFACHQLDSLVLASRYRAASTTRKARRV